MIDDKARYVVAATTAGRIIIAVNLREKLLVSHGRARLLCGKWIPRMPTD